MFVKNLSMQRFIEVFPVSKEKSALEFFTKVQDFTKTLSEYGPMGMLTTTKTLLL